MQKNAFSSIKRLYFRPQGRIVDLVKPAPRGGSGAEFKTVNRIDICINRREIPVKPARRIKEIMKQPDGSLAVLFGSGERGVIPANDPEIQAFAVYSILADL